MNDIHLQEFSKQPNLQEAIIETDGDGFQDQPDLDKDYDPSQDRRDMYRLGKRQQLKRRFRYFSIAGYIVVLGNCWEFSIVTSAFALPNGGTGGAIVRISMPAFVHVGATWNKSPTSANYANPYTFYYIVDVSLRCGSSIYAARTHRLDTIGPSSSV